MLWKLEVVSQDETVAEHEDVQVRGTTFRYFSSMVSGYEATDKESRVVELIGQNNAFHMPVEFNRDENYVCIRGLWVHRSADVYGGAFDAFGIRDDEGKFRDPQHTGKKCEDGLDDGWDDPRLQREWRLRPVLTGVSEID